MDKKAITEKTWEDFRKTGLLWLANQTLHLFGWSIVLKMEGGRVVDAYPARTIFRGFPEEANDDGYKRVSAYLKDNILELEAETQLGNEPQR
jgi:hypothetical protein